MKINDETKKEKISFVIAVFIAATASALLFSHGLQPCDDAYITFRHAKNFATDLWPAWNLMDSPIMGSTSPLFVFLLGGIGFVTGNSDIESIVVIVNNLVFFLIIIIAYLISIDIVKSYFIALGTAILVGFNSFSIYVFSLGFESGLFTLILFACLLFLRKGFYVYAAVLASIAPLVRPEGILVFLLCVSMLFIVKIKIRKILFFLLFFPAIYASFSLSFYGSIFPQSIETKKYFSKIYKPYDKTQNFDAVSRISKTPENVLELWNNNITPLLTQSVFYQKENVTYEYLIFIFFILFSVVFLWIKNDSRLIYFIYPIGFILIYAWVGHTRFWYFPSFILSILLISLPAAFLIIDAINFQYKKYIKIGITFSIFILLLSNNYYFLKDNLLKTEDPRGSVWKFFELERLDSYRRAAKYLNTHPSYQANEYALINEIGYFGYFYNGNVYDAVGLCSPSAVNFYPPSKEEIFNPNGQYRSPSNQIIPKKMISEIKPLYVISADINILHLLRQDSKFLKKYEFEGQTGSAWKNSSVLVFKRK